MSKKENSKNNIKIILFIICLLAVLTASIVIILINIKDENVIENNLDSNEIDDELVSFVDETMNDSEFLRLIDSSFDRNEKIEYCIRKLMKRDNVSKISIDKIIEYYTEIFGNDNNFNLKKYMQDSQLNNYELISETNEYEEKSESIYREERKINEKIKVDSKREEKNQTIANCKIIEPKSLVEIVSYFTKKMKENVDYEKYDTIVRELNDIRGKYIDFNDDEVEFSKEEMEYLLKLVDEDVEKLAYVREFEVVFEKKENGFIIKDIKKK